MPESGKPTPNPQPTSNEPVDYTAEELAEALAYLESAPEDDTLADGNSEAVFISKRPETLKPPQGRSRG